MLNWKTGFPCIMTKLLHAVNSNLLRGASDTTIYYTVLYYQLLYGVAERARLTDTPSIV